MADSLRFDDKVVIVTGAGSGLGRCHALEFARRGAHVLVNDLGSSLRGDGSDQSAADTVVAEITAAGGSAAANHDSVEDGEAIVQAAIDAFGRVDVVINNAGILRDVSFGKMTDQDWDRVYRVHTLGSYRVTRAAWPYLREQRYGRIINTASGAGIYGNFGQVNYSTAKLGLYGFTQSLAIEGASRNITANCIAPVAASRMSETVFPPDFAAALKPEYVTPLVIRLCAENNRENGSLFEVGAGWVGKLRWERSKGVAFNTGEGFSAEDIDSNWDAICDFSDADHPASVAEAYAPIFAKVNNDS